MDKRLIIEIAAILIAVIGGAVWIGNLQGQLSALNPESIKLERDKAINDIKLTYTSLTKKPDQKESFINPDKIKQLEMKLNKFVIENDRKIKAIKSSITKLDKSIIELDINKKSNENKEIEELKISINNLKQSLASIKDNSVNGNSNKNDIELLDMKDIVENNRRAIQEQIKLSKNRISSFKESCDKSILLKENKIFRATVEEFSQKGKTINISVLVKNKTNKDIKISRFNKYAILTSPSGEMQYKSTNRTTTVIGAEDSKAFSYNFILKKDYDGNAFDYILRFEYPESNFAFFGLSNACFQ